MIVYLVEEHGVYHSEEVFASQWVFTTESAAKKFFAELVEKERANDKDNGYDQVYENENTYESWVDGEFAKDSISISWAKVETMDDKPYWAKVYDARQSEKDIETDEKMTLKEVLDLGYNMTKVYNQETGEVLEAGYLDEDGTYAIYDIPEDKLDTTIVKIDERYDDEDGYPCIMVSFVGEK